MRLFQLLTEYTFQESKRTTATAFWFATVACLLMRSTTRRTESCSTLFTIVGLDLLIFTDIACSHSLTSFLSEASLRAIRYSYLLSYSCNIACVPTKKLRQFYSKHVKTIVIITLYKQNNRIYCYFQKIKHFIEAFLFL